MKKSVTIVVCVVCIIILLVSLLSRHKGVVYTSIGLTYNEFLFIPAKDAHFTISFKSPYTGNLTLIDDKGKTLSRNKYIISVDGKRESSSFYVKNKKKVSVNIRSSKTLSFGKHYIQVKGGGPLVTHVYFNHYFNPMLAWLSWVISLLAIVILIWFIFIQKLIFPTFKTYRKNILIMKDGKIITQYKIDFTNARKVVFANRENKQSFLNKILCGKILTFVNDELDEPIVFTPTKNRKSANILGMSYTITPNPMPRSGVATILCQSKKLHITLN